jgi:hypothetical protein
MNESGRELETMPMQITHNIRRALGVQQALDPEQQLPKFDLQKIPTLLVQEPPRVRERFLILHGANFIGQTVLVSNPVDRMRNMEYIQLDYNLQGQPGHTATYIAALTGAMIDGYSFKTHEHSDNIYAKSVWERLVDGGLARMIKNFKAIDGGMFRGHFILDSPQIVAQQAIKLRSAIPPNEQP